MKRNTLFKVLTLVVIFLVLELIGWVAIKYFKTEYEKIRKILVGKEEFIGLQNMISQPYLFYVNSPGLVKDGYKQNNEHGYRGKKVPLKKPSGAYRILFMGGSTTYSNWVADPDSSYPAQMGFDLNRFLRDGKISNEKIKSIEVINGGLSWGTSAEILTHYTFKYRYYDPDLVVINTGGNDAYAHFLGGPYQPDFFHFRKTMRDVQPVRQPYRLLFHSRIISFFLINIFYDDLVKGGQFVHNGERTKIRWYDPSDQELTPVDHLEYNAFYKNLNTVIDEMKKDGAEVLLVPFLGNWQHHEYTDTILQMHYFYNDLLKQIAKERQVHFVPFGPEVITNQDYWMDDCHLNTKGVREKVEHLSKYILPILNKPDTLNSFSLNNIDE